MSKELTKEQQSAEREAFLLARSIWNGEFNPAELSCPPYDPYGLVFFKRKKLIYSLIQNDIDLEPVKAQFVDDNVISYSNLLKSIIQKDETPRPYQLKKNNGEVIDTFDTKSVWYPNLFGLFDELDREELDYESKNLKELLDRYEHTGLKSGLHFLITLLDEKGRASHRVLEEHVRELSGGRYNIEFTEDPKRYGHSTEDSVYTWKKSPEDILYDEGLDLCISIEPQTFGISPAKNLNYAGLSNSEQISRLTLTDQIPYCRSSINTDLNNRMCRADLDLRNGEHFPDPIRARDILRKIVDCDALEFKF